MGSRPSKNNFAGQIAHVIALQTIVLHFFAAGFARKRTILFVSFAPFASLLHRPSPLRRAVCTSVGLNLMSPSPSSPLTLSSHFVYLHHLSSSPFVTEKRVRSEKPGRTRNANSRGRGEMHSHVVAARRKNERKEVFQRSRWRAAVAVRFYRGRLCAWHFRLSQSVNRTERIDASTRSRGRS